MSLLENSTTYPWEKETKDKRICSCYYKDRFELKESLQVSPDQTSRMTPSKILVFQLHWKQFSVYYKDFSLKKFKIFMNISVYETCSHTKIHPFDLLQCTTTTLTVRELLPSISPLCLVALMGPFLPPHSDLFTGLSDRCHPCGISNGIVRIEFLISLLLHELHIIFPISANGTMVHPTV